MKGLLVVQVPLPQLGHPVMNVFVGVGTRDDVGGFLLGVSGGEILDEIDLLT